SSAPVARFVAYADTSASGVAAVPAQPAPKTSLLFAQIADLPPWATGLALLNTTSTDAIVEAFAMTPAGAVIGGAANVPTARFTLKAGTKVAKLRSELIPETQMQTSYGGLSLCGQQTTFRSMESSLFSRGTWRYW